MTKVSSPYRSGCFLCLHFKILTLYFFWKPPNNNQDTPFEAKFGDGTVNVPSKQKAGPVFDENS